VGDILAELGVVVVPRLESISHEAQATRNEAERAAHGALMSDKPEF
jgi:hypothetical protein